MVYADKCHAKLCRTISATPVNAAGTSGRDTYASCCSQRSSSPATSSSTASGRTSRGDPGDRGTECIVYTPLLSVRITTYTGVLHGVHHYIQWCITRGEDTGALSRGSKVLLK